MGGNCGRGAAEKPSEDGGSAVLEGEGREVLYEACHGTLAQLELLQVVMEYVGGEGFLFVAGTSKEWRTRYAHLYPALRTSLLSVVASVECVRWAIRKGLELSEEVFRAAARCGDVEVCKVLHGKNCPWDWSVCQATMSNEQHGLSILQWLRSEHLPEKERCPWDERICDVAGRKGKLEMLKWLLSEEGNAPFGSHDWNRACLEGRVPVVECLLNQPRTRALLEQNQDGVWRSGAEWAAQNGHLGVLQLLHADARHLCHWTMAVCENAVLWGGSLATLQWLRSEQVQCAWSEWSCPQFVRDRGVPSNIDDETFEEMKQWVHANGHPCNCED